MIKIKFKKSSSQNGYIILVAVLMILIVGLMGVVIAQLFFGSTFSTIAHHQADAALYLAESGIEGETHKLLQPSLASRNTCAGLNAKPFANTLGAGSYSVSTTSQGIAAGFVSSPTILNGALAAVLTTRSITVENTSGYQSFGRIMIDSEFINYTSIDATHFNGVTRAVDGSAVAPHATGTAIGQYQCNITSQAGVPSLTTALGKRTIKDTVQLQEAWAVGIAVADSTYVIAQWNNPTELAWNYTPISSATASNLYGVSITSYVDGWAVGEAQGNYPTILHWNGLTWIRVLPDAQVNVALNGVSCVNKNNCWAVGGNDSNNPVMERWNGVSWSRVMPAGLNNAALTSVYCNEVSDCWAVGKNLASTPLVEHWNGVAWARVVPTDDTNFGLNSVFCNSATDCWAVGDKTGNGPLIEHWNGSAWSNQAATILGVNNADLHGIACVNKNDCWAVGDALGSDFFMHWNGTNWIRDASMPQPVANLKSVDCISANDCWAVGETNVEANASMVHWDGLSWERFTSVVNGPVATGRGLNAVCLVGGGGKPMAGWREVF